ncbi:hypothetical protein N7478_007559 [Penicillium angulare]|uniref:uncharacterized protein n=1 Tax=Penicillium angulare TaxID=116970 RepID=UPI0025425250|nr:uncharacterized protein N7478_007559 [Penicillium angulare]KAJ5272434.1 hypothetical protein N7478_007559 [Penicillium angulare]
MRIYKKGLMCVNRKCSQLGKIDGAEVDDPKALEYDDNFLSYRLQWDLSEFLQRAEFPLIPPVPNITPENQRQLQYGKDATKGMVCPLCSKCVPRVYFLGWKCDVDLIVGPNVPDNEKGCPWELMFKPSPIEFGSRPKEEVETFHRGRKFSVRWQLPADEDKTNLLPEHKYVSEQPCGGTVTHFASNAVINTRDHGPDYLFHSLQASDLGLRRHRLSITNWMGAMTNSFIRNFGAPFKFCVPTISTSFHEAHPDILHAYGRLDWAFRQVSESSEVPYKRPNEILVMGYLENQELSLKYHDDGCGNLGPTIVTLSLDTKAHVYFHMKPTYYYGVSKRGVPLSADPVLEGCDKYAIRKELKEKYLAGQIDEDFYDKERCRVLKWKTKKAQIYIKNGSSSWSSGGHEWN